MLSQDSGVDAIVFAGSVFGAEVAIARTAVQVPVLTSFEAMVEFALDLGFRFEVLSSAPESLPLLVAELQREAERRGRTVMISGSDQPQAFEALYIKGDSRTHDELIAEMIRAASECDAILLAQFSMRGAKNLVLAPPAPVLDPISSAIKALQSLLGQSASSPAAN